MINKAYKKVNEQFLREKALQALHDERLPESEIETLLQFVKINPHVRFDWEALRKIPASAFKLHEAAVRFAKYIHILTKDENFSYTQKDGYDPAHSFFGMLHFADQENALAYVKSRFPDKPEMWKVVPSRKY